MQDQIEIFLGHVLVRREQADLEMLARRDGEPQPIDIGLRAGKGARPADGAHLDCRRGTGTSTSGAARAL
jgi:hypothetical protein